jgi:hypothetical protein
MAKDDGSDSRSVDDEEPAVELGDAFDLLGSQRRRWMLQYLEAVDDEVVPLKDVAEHVQKRQRRCADGEASGPGTRSVYNELYHAHVPRLQTAGIANYDADDDLLRVERVPDPIADLLAVASDFEPTADEQ